MRPQLDWAGFGDVDFAVEAVFEVAEVKRPVLEEARPSSPRPRHHRLEHLVAVDHAPRPRASPTAARRWRSTSSTRRRFSPYVEVSGGIDTREDVVSETIDFLQGLRNHRGPMVPIRVKESPAFVVNRILLPILNEACFELEEGLASSRDIDIAMKAGAGMPMGPFELADMIGLDVTLEIAGTLVRETGDPRYPARRHVLRQLVDAGHLGRKTGRGFYEYP